MPRVMPFEINAPDPDGLVDFYKNAFEWEIAKWDGPGDYWLMTTGEEGQPGISGAMMRSQDGQHTRSTPSGLIRWRRPSPG